MGWGSALKRGRTFETESAIRPQIVNDDVDWDRLVSLDFETFYDADYTLRKLSTSEYIRDPRFEALMCGIKVGRKKTKLVHGPKVAEELRKINWETHSLLAHHAQFDGFILSHHYGVKPKRIYCTLSMARGLHSTEIGAGLDEVSQFYGGRGKIAGGVENMAGLRYKDLVKNKTAWTKSAEYCVNDVEEMYRIFTLMHPKMPVEEMDIIDITCRLFTDPVLQVDEERVAKELERELEEKKQLLISIIGTPKVVKARLTQILDDKKLQAKACFRGMTAEEILLEEARKMISSNESFANLLRAEGVEPPVKISPAYFKHRDEEKKWAYAFAKTDLNFTQLSEHPKKRVRDLVECRLSVKSTIDETRAGRLLQAGKGGLPLPVYLRYYGAHTGRWSGGNKMNLQNLRRGGELRKSIKAPKGYMVLVADSGQIEARVNAWLWGQEDLLEAFRNADLGLDRDAYCKFGDTIYGREITKADTLERFVSKIAVLGLGYQMGAPKFQNTLALGTMGPPVYFELDMCQKIVTAYRRKNFKIAQGWQICSRIISDMAAGRCGTHGPISWEKETIWLPNGMALKYPDLKMKVDGDFEEWSYSRKGERAKIYGGLLCENIVQALARIIVGKQLLDIAKHNRVVMTTHDEVVALEKVKAAQKSFDRMVKIMRTPPEWCADIPLNAEGGFDVIYSK
jgi:DNA polymerase